MRDTCIAASAPAKRLIKAITGWCHAMPLPVIKMRCRRRRTAPRSGNRRAPGLRAGAIAPLALLDLYGWPAVAAALGVFVYELLAYAYRRGMHSADAWFRVSHQMHHGAERLDVYGAFQFSPLDIVGWTLVPSVTLTLLGLPPAVATTILAITFFGVFPPPCRWHMRCGVGVGVGVGVDRKLSHF
jgi:hypothetical protein